MGCDIHVFVEYEFYTNYWCSLALDEFNFGRNYEIFGLLGGVRGGEALMEPRGLPENISWPVSDSVYLTVGEDITEEKAERYVNLHGCKAKRNLTSDTRILHVTNPDYHTHSWLTFDEYKKVFKKIKNLKDVSSRDVVLYEIIFNTMKTLKEHYNTRLVFWFDN